MILLLCFCLCIQPCTVLAASTSEAGAAEIDTNEDCSLTIRYHYDGTAFQGQTVTLYKIAEVSSDFQYTLIPTLEVTGLVLNGVSSQTEWNVIRSTLEAYITAGHAEPPQSVVTDERGNVYFDSLKPGLYLASAVHVEQEDISCVFDSALIALPGLNTDGDWQYQVAVAAKPEILPPVDPDEEIQWKVLKLWKGDNGQKVRPQSIVVEIFRNGKSYATVMLSEENHWAYSWSAGKDGDDWKVVEQNIPAGYTMTVDQRDTTFVITNTRPDQPDSPPPKTGDTSPMLLYAVLMYVSGMILVILGVAGKRKRYEKTTEISS